MYYIEKPKLIEAVQWTGSNKEELETFISGMYKIKVSKNLFWLLSPEHIMYLDTGDYLIKEKEIFKTIEQKEFENKYQYYGHKRTKKIEGLY